ncbi:MAG: PHP domain-containing protein [Actinobacteria bacterium]|nr:PHP domain-containing protein [Actinomycetota bacterium]
MPGPSVRLDLHNHTRFSSDGLMSPAALLKKAARRGIHCLAVTDHNTVQGALEALALADADPSLPRVIPGVELLTADGEIIGLYVREEIPAGLPLEESAALIREQGGLISLPHPYDLFRRGAISREARLRAAQIADMIEVVNGRSLGPRANRKAAELAWLVGRPGCAGSDAHRKVEVGMAYVVVDSLPTRETLVSLVGAGGVRHRLNPREYTLNWGMQGLAPVTRMRRRVAGYF